ncbi:hypothetical protein TRVL_00959 [Trypanosoma vivax]|nr:hypothetical protein TRVL_00959 [Trypanosoma vivax]
MVRWGGPRFEFYREADYLNHEQFIKKEEAQRVAFIRSLREKEQTTRERQMREQDAVNVQKQKERPCQSKLVEDAARRAAAAAAAQSSSHARRIARLKELSAPVVRGGPMHAAGTHGCVMYPTAKGVPLPKGRAGRPYMPGVDRDRVVPPPPPAEAPKPWMHTGVSWMPDAETKNQEKYYFKAPKCDSAVAQKREQCIDGIELCHSVEGCRETVGHDKATETVKGPVFSKSQDLDAASEHGSEASIPPSIFSHGSSNAPIRLLGTQHMDTVTTAEEVKRHLTLHKEGKLPARRCKRKSLPFEKMNLTELTSALMQMQKTVRH